MGAVGGTALRVLSTLLYTLTLLCSIVILALYSYFLAAESTHDVKGPNRNRAIEGIAGVGVLYSIVAVLLTCFLGGVMAFAFIGIVLDILLAGGFIAVAIMARHGGGSCNGFVHTPLGDGDATSHRGWDGKIFTPTLGTACKMNKSVLAVAILGAGLFVIAAAVQFWLGRHHQKEKRYGPSPANNYTRGNGIKFFKRRKGAKSAHAATTKDAEAGVVPETTHEHGHGHHEPTLGHDSHPDPRYDTPAMNAYVGNKYEPGQNGHHTTAAPAAGGYHTGPTGSAVNPYNYDSRPAQNY